MDLNNLVGRNIAILYLCGQVQLLVANDCFLLMFHLSCYSIAYYIQSLRAKLDNDNNLDSPWKGNKKILIHLYEAFSAFKSLFSVPILYIVTLKLIIVALNLFAFIYSLVKPSDSFVGTWMFDMFAQVIISLAHLLIILLAADLPIYQVFIIFRLK